MLVLKLNKIVSAALNHLREVLGLDSLALVDTNFSGGRLPLIVSYLESASALEPELRLSYTDW